VLVPSALLDVPAPAEPVLVPSAPVDVLAPAVPVLVPKAPVVPLVPAPVPSAPLALVPLGATIGTAGVVYALWRDTLDPSLLFLLVFTLSAMVMLLAIVVAYRVRPTNSAPSRSRSDEWGTKE